MVARIAAKSAEVNLHNRCLILVSCIGEW